MTILIYEDNLMWSVKLRNSLQAAGHRAFVISSWPETIPAADAAIINLGSERLKPLEFTERLHEAGIPCVGHAGHKEKDLLQSGREGGVDMLVSNGELSAKAPEVIERLLNLPRTNA